MIPKEIVLKFAEEFLRTYRRSRGSQYNHLEDIASEINRIYGMPCKNYVGFSLEEILGMMSLFGLGIKVSNKLKKERGRISNKVIYLREGLSVNQMRFTLLHELAHVLLEHNGKDNFSDVRDDGLISYFSFIFDSFGEQENGKIHKYFRYLHEESEANYLAAAILMPKDIFLHVVFSKQFDIDKVSDLFGVTYETAAHRLAILAPINMHFVRVLPDGSIEKAYSNRNNKFPFWGKRICQHSIAYKIFGTKEPWAHQFTFFRETKDRYYCRTRRIEQQIGAEKRTYSVSIGCAASDANYFPDSYTADSEEAWHRCEINCEGNKSLSCPIWTRGKGEIGKFKPFFKKTAR